MKTIKQVKAERPEHKTLISGVLNRIGTDYIEDVNSHGADAGFPGFTYYDDTHRFAMRHRKTIVSMLENQAQELGEEVVEMVSHFGVFRKSPMDNEDRRELYRYLSGAKCEQSTITNLMAWFALEEVCRMFEE